MTEFMRQQARERALDKALEAHRATPGGVAPEVILATAERFLGFLEGTARTSKKKQ